MIDTFLINLKTDFEKLDQQINSLSCENKSLTFET